MLQLLNLETLFFDIDSSFLEIVFTKNNFISIYT